MNEPRIGDTIHYVPHFGTPACLAATVTSNTPREFTAYALRPTGGNHHDCYTVYPRRDPNEFTDDDGKHWMPAGGTFTPGTWHHVH